jgi:hypothetical protein
MQKMGAAIQTIVIQNAAPQPGCGTCLHTSGKPVCRTAPGQACAAPRLQGSAADVHKVMAALGPVLGFDACAADAGTGVVLSLSVKPGEVDLHLVAGRHCGGAALADAAFQALRGLLPDTDLYVRNKA